MRLVLMFDLPVENKSQQKEYRIFHKHLIKNGFLMLQYSVYVRFCTNDSMASLCIARVQKKLPREGNVRILKITENQFNQMIVLSGEKSEREKIEKENNLTVIE